MIQGPKTAVPDRPAVIVFHAGSARLINVDVQPHLDWEKPYALSCHRLWRA
jgi:hypothetical protein